MTITRLPLDPIYIVKIDIAIIGMDGSRCTAGIDLPMIVTRTIDHFPINFQGPIPSLRTRTTAHIELNDIRPVP